MPFCRCGLLFPLKTRSVPTHTSTPASVAAVAPTTRPHQAPDLATVVELVKPSVVRIGTHDGSGTGIIFETTTQQHALILTNYHVIEGGNGVEVQANDSLTYRGKVVGYDAVRDLAVLEICCGQFQALNFDDSEDIKPGTEVIAIGYALGLTGSATVTRGIVSAVRFDKEYNSWVLQTDVPINPGNSGGPLLSASGDVLGINTFGIDLSPAGISTEGLGFALSERTVQAILPELKQASRFVSSAPTLIPQPTLRNTPAPAPTLAAAPKPTARLPVAGGDYFTVGSTKDEVLVAQGTPNRFTDTRWEYGITSWVRFQDDRVIDWNDTDYDKLNARLEP